MPTVFRQRSAPLLAAQAAIWEADRAQGGHLFVAAQVTTLPPHLDLRLFSQACRIVVRQTPALRLRLTAAPAQYVVPAEESGEDLRVVDLSTDSDPQTAADLWMGRARRAPIDLQRDAPFSWTLLRLGHDRLLWFQTWHLAAFDAGTWQDIVALVAATYEGLAAGSPPLLPPRTPVAERLRQEAAYVASARYRADAAWSLRQCENPPATASLSRRPAAGLAVAGRQTRVLDPACTAALQRAAARLGVSLPQLICCGWTVLLARMTGQNDMLIGLHVATRRAPDGAAPSCTTNRVALRLAVPPELNFAAWVLRAGRACRSALRHRHYPHAHLRRALDLSASDPDPLEIGLRFVPPPSAPSLAGQTLDSRNLSFGAVHDMVLSVQAGACDLTLHLDCNSDRYTAAEGERLVSRVALLLDRIAADPGGLAGTALGLLPMMDETERLLVSERFSQAAPPPVETTIAALFAARVRQSPDGIALYAGGTTLTYAELEGRASRLARHLLAAGVAPGSVVAVALPREADLIVSLVACSLAGIAACPLEPDYPRERMTHMLATSRAQLVLASTAFATPFEGVRVLALDAPATRAALARQPDHGLADSEGAGSIERPLAYVAFTSGSTGRPKGVAITQAALAHHVQAIGQRIPVGPGDTVLCMTTITFDVAMGDVFLALTSGAALILLDDNARRDPAQIRAAAMAHHAPLLQATPSLLRTLPLETLPACLRVAVGGEAFPADLLPRLLRLRAVFNVYGPTEATVWATVQKLDATTHAGQPISVGRPLAGYSVWILDAESQPLPIDGIGELCIGGPAVAGGYLGEPGLTAKAFGLSPFGQGRIYRTGDLARWRDDGTIEVLGRRDRQVKISGHRVELEEIERALNDLPPIHETVVLAVRDGGGPPRLAAYVVAKPGAVVPELAALRGALAVQLPAWMMPSTLTVLDAMPRTVNGKIDRLALKPPVPAMRPAARHQAAQFAATAPASASERLLRILFGRITGTPDVGAHDDFFEIGGDSLAAMILLTELSRAGYEVPLQVVMQRRTPEAIASAMRGHAATQEDRRQTPMVFLIPGAGGDNPALAEFRAACAADIDFVLLDYPDWPKLAAPGFGPRQLAEDFAARITAFAPSGPVLLAGYSLGGVVAFEVASALMADGREMGGLLILDTSIEPDADDDAAVRTAGVLARRIVDEMRHDFQDGDSSRTLARIIGGRLGRAPALLRVLAHLRAGRLPRRLRHRMHFHLAAELQIRIVSPWHERLLRSRRILPGLPTVLLAAAGRDSGGSDMGWGRHGLDLTIVEVKGDHFTLLRESGPGSARITVSQAVARLVSARPASFRPADGPPADARPADPRLTNTRLVDS